jgi:hypothetical protein
MLQIIIHKCESQCKFPLIIKRLYFYINDKLKWRLMIGYLCFSFCMAETENCIVINIITCTVVVVATVRVKIVIPYPTLNLFSLALYFFMNKESMKRYIVRLNSYHSRICSVLSYRIITIYRYQMISLFKTSHICPSFLLSYHHLRSS